MSTGCAMTGIHQGGRLRGRVWSLLRRYGLRAKDSA